jgi:hypothetical protein
MKRLASIDRFTLWQGDDSDDFYYDYQQQHLNNNNNNLIFYSLYIHACSLNFIFFLFSRFYTI